MARLSPNFERWEFKCPCGCGFDTVDKELLEYDQALSDHFDNRRVIITSACRCAAYNASVGGGPNSQHLFGRANDIIIEGIHPHLVQELLDDWGVPGLGYYDDFTHLDTRTGRARWDKRAAASDVQLG
ncbi:MAG: D-Ala-D-Ala carboxypeptidase family metallohydrolase [Pseudomonadota bacterium]